MDFNSNPLEPEPRFRLEGNSIEELMEQLQAIAPESDDFQFLSRKPERPRFAEDAEPPERVSHLDLRDLAEELTHRFEETPPPPAEDEEPDFSHSNWHPTRRSEPGEVRQRLLVRRARLLEKEAGYVWLHEAMNARELEDREEAVEQLELVGDAARIERLAEHSPHRITRRAALEALARIKAIPALESAALYVRPEVFMPKATPAEEKTEETAPAKHQDFYDDTRDLAVDLLARLSDEGQTEALDALIRVIRYDFARDTGSRYRSLRRLGERLDALEARHDWEGLALLYREGRSARLRQDAVERLAPHLEELEAAGEVDALLAVADLRADLRDSAEAAVKRIEHP